jgi:hypothetical protein
VVQEVQRKQRMAQMETMALKGEIHLGAVSSLSLAAVRELEEV